MFCFPAASQQQRIQPARMHSCPSSVLLGADKVAPAAMALSQQPGSIMLTLSKGQGSKDHFFFFFFFYHF
jgi:hypothetical protein